MNSPNNGRDRVPSGYLLSPSEVFSTRINLYLIEAWAHGNCQISLLSRHCPPQTDGEAPLLKITTTQLRELGQVQLVPTESFHTYVLVFDTGRNAVHYQKRNVNTSPATKPLIYNSVPSARSASAMVAQRLSE